VAILDAAGKLVASTPVGTSVGPIAWIAEDFDGDPALAWGDGKKLWLTTLHGDGNTSTRQLADLGPPDAAARDDDRMSRRTNIGRLAASPDGTRFLALMTYCGFPCAANLWLVGRDGSLDLISEQVLTAGWISLSPDGQTVLANAGDASRPALIGLSTHAVTALDALPRVDQALGGFASARWLPDGRILAGIQDEKKDSWSGTDPLPLSFWLLSADLETSARIATHAYDVEP
jgi:hypothetical protein